MSWQDLPPNLGGSLSSVADGYGLRGAEISYELSGTCKVLHVPVYVLQLLCYNITLSGYSVNSHFSISIRVIGCGIIFCFVTGT